MEQRKRATLQCKKCGLKFYELNDEGLCLACERWGDIENDDGYTEPLD